MKTNKLSRSDFEFEDLTRTKVLVTYTDTMGMRWKRIVADTLLVEAVKSRSRDSDLSELAILCKGGTRPRRIIH